MNQKGTISTISEFADQHQRTEHIAQIIIHGMMVSMDSSDLQLYIDLYDRNTK